MKALPLSEAKANLSGLVRSINRTEDEIVITKNGRPAAVLISADEFNSWKETMAIRSEPELLREIRRGLKALKKKKAKLYTLEELFPEE